MAEQLLDLRQSLGALRRYRLVLAGTALLGAAAGVALSSSQAPAYTSTSQVLLPQLAVGGQLVNRDPATESQVADSAAVLQIAGDRLTPQRSAAEVGRLVSVTTPGDNVIEYSVRADDAHLARSVAAAAAAAEVEYIREGTNSVIGKRMAALEDRRKFQQSQYDDLARQLQAATNRMKTQTGAQRLQTANLRGELADDLSRTGSTLDEIAKDKSDLGNDSSTAQVIQPATTPTRPGQVTRDALQGLAGAGLALMLGALVVVLRAGRDKRLRARDAVAAATGSTVLGSVASQAPRTTSGWSRLLAGYAPDATDAWALRQLLRRLDAGPSSSVRPGSADSRPTRLTLFALADDAAGVAVAVQLVSYAATTGLRTRLVPSGTAAAAAPLRAALQRGDGQEVRPGLELAAHPTAADETEVTGRPDLTVGLVLLDRREPAADVGWAVDSDRATLVVSAGAATGEDLARVALAADDAGARLDGVVVADPDDLDHTTGTLDHRARPAAPTGPSRITGVPSLGFGASQGGR